MSVAHTLRYMAMYGYVCVCTDNKHLCVDHLGISTWPASHARCGLACEPCSHRPGLRAMLASVGPASHARTCLTWLASYARNSLACEPCSKGITRGGASTRGGGQGQPADTMWLKPRTFANLDLTMWPKPNTLANSRSSRPWGGP